MSRFIFSALFVFSFLSLASAADVRFDSGSISGLSARNIGSAMMSGRVSAVTAVPDGGSLTIYVGAASGGV